MFKRRLIAADQASVFMSMMSVHISSGLVLHQMTSDHNRSELGIQDHSNEPSSSKLVPKVARQLSNRREKRDGSRFGTPHVIISDRGPLGENRASWSNKLDDALWAFRAAFKTPIGCTPYKLVYEKACHLPIELEHKAYWALKHCNFVLKTAEIPSGESKVHIEVLSVLWGNRLPIPDGSLPLSSLLKGRGIHRGRNKTPGPWSARIPMWQLFKGPRFNNVAIIIIKPNFDSEVTSDEVKADVSKIIPPGSRDDALSNYLAKVEAPHGGAMYNFSNCISFV
ncbi:reverse transcriptase domain-containing protein [Tanacetum coccineum]